MLPVLLTLATLVAVGLMVAVLVRMGKRYDALQAEFDRLKVVQRDMSTDVRSRLDEGTRTWEAVESELRPRIEAIDPLKASIQEMRTALDENLPALGEARRRLEAVEEQGAGTEARVTAALETAAQDVDARFDRIEEAVRTLRNAADERLADLAGRVSALEDASAAPGEPAPVAVGVAAEEAEDDGLAPPPLPTSSSRVASTPDAPSTEETSRGTSAAGRWVLIALLLAIGLVAWLKSMGH